MRQIARATTLWTILLVCVLLVAGAVHGQQPASQLGQAAIGGTVVSASGRPEAARP